MFTKINGEALEVEVKSFVETRIRYSVYVIEEGYYCTSSMIDDDLTRIWKTRDEALSGNINTKTWEDLNSR